MNSSTSPDHGKASLLQTAHILLSRQAGYENGLSAFHEEPFLSFPFLPVVRRTLFDSQGVI